MLFLGQRYDLGHGKERQISPWLRGIQGDHKSRYYFAAEGGKGSQRILDLACGVGYGSYILATELPDSTVTAVDMSEFAVGYATKHYNHPNISYQVKDGRSLVGESQFDCIVSYETLEHIDDERSFVSTLRRLATNDAKLYISTPNEANYPFDPSYNQFHVRHHTPSQLDQLLESCGWKVEARYCQKDREPGAVVDGTDGLFLIYIAVAA